MIGNSKIGSTFSISQALGVGSMVIGKTFSISELLGIGRMTIGKTFKITFKKQIGIGFMVIRTNFIIK